jgi:hypothetical protein
MAVLPASAGTLADLIVELVGKLPYVLVGLICLAWLSAPAELVMPIVGGLTAAALLTALFFVVGFRGRFALERFALILSKRFPDFAAASMERLRSDFHALFGQRRALSAAFLLHFLCWLAGAFETWLLFRLMGISLGSSRGHRDRQPDVRFADTRLLRARRGRAYREASYALLGALFGVTPAAAIGFSLARRARISSSAFPFCSPGTSRKGRPGVASRTARDAPAWPLVRRPT